MSLLPRHWTRTALTLSALAVTAALSGCGTTVTENHPGQSISAPVPIPPAFNNYALWSSQADGSITPVVVGDTVVYMAPTGKDIYTISAIDNLTGNQKWTGQPQTIPDNNNGSPLALYSLTVNQRPYVIVVIPLPGDNDTRVDIYDPNRSGLNAQPTAVRQFQATTAPPTVVVTSAGISVNGVDDRDQYILDPASGNSQRYVGTLDRQVGGEKATERLWVRYGNATVNYWVNGGFSYRGTSGGWSSDDIEPTGTQKHTGSTLAANNGYIVSRWDGLYSKQEVIVVQDILTGRVTATYAHTADTDSTADQTALHVSDDGKWLTWKQFAFNIKASIGYQIPDGVTITAVSDGFAYGLRDKKPVAFDIVTGQITETGFAAIPRAFTDQTGVFTSTTDATALLFAASERLVN